MNANEFLHGVSSDQSVTMLATALCNIDKTLTKLADETVPGIRDDVHKWQTATDTRITQNEASIKGLMDKTAALAKIDERLHNIERDREKFVGVCETVHEHIKNDKPMEHYMGKWALGLVMFVATIAGAFVVNRILHIVEIHGGG